MSINKIHTPCKKCVFADYTENTQTGCFLGLIDNYRHTDFIEIIEAYDREKEFFIVSGKKCFGYKEQKYFDSRDMQNSSIEEKVAYMKKISRMKYIAIVDCLDRTPDELLEVVAEIKKADVLPDTILVVILEGGDYPYSEYFKALNKSNIGTKWKIKGNLYKEQDFFTTVHQTINLGAEQCNFILSVGKNYNKVKEIIDHANDLVYNEYKTFSVISNESKDTIIFNKYVYQAALVANGDIITDYQEYIII